MSDEYRHLQPCEKIQEGDEYNTGSGMWRIVPDFLVGDIVQESSTQWRRITKESNKPNESSKKNRFWSLFKKK